MIDLSGGRATSRLHSARKVIDNMATFLKPKSFLRPDRVGDGKEALKELDRIVRDQGKRRALERERIRRQVIDIGRPAAGGPPKIIYPGLSAKASEFERRFGAVRDVADNLLLSEALRALLPFGAGLLVDAMARDYERFLKQSAAANDGAAMYQWPLRPGWQEYTGLQCYAPFNDIVAGPGSAPTSCTKLYTSVSTRPNSLEWVWAWVGPNAYTNTQQRYVGSYSQYYKRRRFVRYNAPSNPGPAMAPRKLPAETYFKVGISMPTFPGEVFPWNQVQPQLRPRTRDALNKVKEILTEASLEPLPKARFRPRRYLKPKTQTMVSSVINGGSVTNVTNPPYERRPPQRRTKEKKAFLNPVVAKFLSTVTETMDWITAVFWALPEERTRGYTNPGDKALRIVAHFDEIDWEQAFWNVVVMQLQDTAIGKGAKAAQRGQRKLTGRSDRASTLGIGVGQYLKTL